LEGARPAAISLACFAAALVMLRAFRLFALAHSPPMPGISLYYFQVFTLLWALAFLLLLPHGLGLAIGEGTQNRLAGAVIAAVSIYGAGKAFLRVLAVRVPKGFVGIRFSARNGTDRQPLGAGWHRAFPSVIALVPVSPQVRTVSIDLSHLGFSGVSAEFLCRAKVREDLAWLLVEQLGGLEAEHLGRMIAGVIKTALARETFPGSISKLLTEIPAKLKDAISSTPFVLECFALSALEFKFESPSPALPGEQPAKSMSNYPVTLPVEIVVSPTVRASLAAAVELKVEKDDRNMLGRRNISTPRLSQVLRTALRSRLSREPLLEYLPFTEDAKQKFTEALGICVRAQIPAAEGARPLWLNLRFAENA